MMRRHETAALPAEDTDAGSGKTRRRHMFPGAIIAVTGLLTACVANPGPPPIELGQEAESSASDVARGDNPSASESGAEQSRPGESDAEQREHGRNSAEKSQVGVGIDPIHFGLNPHLKANQQAVVDDIAALVLPSAFVNGEITELLDSAEEVPVNEHHTRSDEQQGEKDSARPAEAESESAVGTSAQPVDPADQPVVQKVRYEISTQAQWSDGTPITGEDFIYLWQQMTSTPGAVGAAGYFAISDITTTAGGKIVDVEFSQRVNDWWELFRYLLPAHLMNTPFAAARELPASAGRYHIDGVDWARGKVTLHRNDRFWGADPARIDVLELTEIRNPAQGLNLMRSGQIAFADLTPGETTFLSYSALPGTQVFRLNTQRQLQVELLGQSPIFREHDVRAEFARALDIPSLAVQATGRRTDLRIPGNPGEAAKMVGSGDSAVHDGTMGPRELFEEHVALLQQHTSNQRPLRIAADPADAVANAAASVLVDRMVAAGVVAEVVTDDFVSISEELVPDGAVDAVISWSDTSTTSFNLADDLLCRAPATNTAHADWLPQCLPEIGNAWSEVLSGAVDNDRASQLVSTLESDHVLHIPVLDERRIRILGSGMVGPEPELEDWSAGLKLAPFWDLAGPGGPAGSADKRAAAPLTVEPDNPEP
ncbi:ABC transporter substrate-binding protein [Corynebacterium sp. MSK297]|uniref:ABC transporter substrate-binding protein n=1 Tax=Corynebacterium sp. MSK297 TaxID=3050221 RepID=UPI00254CE1D2|nr:ABC transporter substrate-binding protein [Corynebacterium sp. MSK297]MDK8845988.1 ABC transporter substrate-binding protein [Corynebacterium sp. MSK297]